MSEVWAKERMRGPGAGEEAFDKRERRGGGCSRGSDYHPPTCQRVQATVIDSLSSFQGEFSSY